MHESNIAIYLYLSWGFYLSNCFNVEGKANAFYNNLISNVTHFLGGGSQYCCRSTQDLNASYIACLLFLYITKDDAMATMQHSVIASGLLPVSTRSQFHCMWLLVLFQHYLLDGSGWLFTLCTTGGWGIFLAKLLAHVAHVDKENTFSQDASRQLF